MKSNSKKFQPYLKGERGFTLVELLLTLAGSSVLALAVSSFTTFTQDTIQKTIENGSRDDIQFAIIQTLNNEKAIKKTRELDQVFGACFLVSWENNYCLAQQELGMTLYDATGMKIAGPPDDPLMYDTDGRPCQKVKLDNVPEFTTEKHNDKCIIEVTSTVRAQGIPNWVNNELFEKQWRYHELVEIRYKIHVKPINNNVHASTRDIKGSVAIDLNDTDAIVW